MWRVGDERTPGATAKLTHGTTSSTGYPIRTIWVRPFGMRMAARENRAYPLRMADRKVAGYSPAFTSTTSYRLLPSCSIG